LKQVKFAKDQKMLPQTRNPGGQQTPPHIKRTTLKLTKAASSKLYYICKFPKPLEFDKFDPPLKVRLKGKEDEEADIAEKPQEEEPEPEEEVPSYLNKRKVKRNQKHEYILEESGAKKKAFEGLPEETQDAKYALFITRQNPKTMETEFGVLSVGSQWLNFRPRILKANLTVSTLEQAEKRMKQKDDAINKQWMRIKPEIAEENKRSRKQKKEKEVDDEMDFEDIQDDDDKEECETKISKESRIEAKTVFGSDDEGSDSEDSSSDEDDETRRAKEEQKKSRNEFKKLLKKEEGEDEENEEDLMLKEKVKSHEKKRKQDEIEGPTSSVIKTEEPETKKVKKESSEDDFEKLKQEIVKYIKKKKGEVKLSKFKKKFLKGPEDKETRKTMLLEAMKQVRALTYNENGKTVVRISTEQ